MNARSLFPPATLLFLALWFFLLLAGQSRFFQDPGTYWHTVVGKQILTSRGFFDTDEFTFTHAGKTWIPHQWLGECLMAVAHSLDGFDTLLLLTATLLACLYTWLGVRLMRSGLHPSLSILLIALAVATSSGHFHVRPHLGTIVCFAIVMATLCDFEARRIGIGALARLIPLFLVWSNIHGGMLGGWATFALAVAFWLVAWKLGLESPISSYRQAALLGLILLASAATAIINPYGIRLPETWIDIYRMKSLTRLIKEHAPLDLSDRNAWVILLFGLVYLVLFAGTLARQPRVVWLLPLIWLVLACMRVRHAPLFAVAALVALADLFPKTKYAERLQARGSDLFTPPQVNTAPLRNRSIACIVPVLVVLVAVALQAFRLPIPLVGHGWARENPDIWPVALLDELQARQYERPEGTRIFNEYALGGFLIYHARGYRVFVDDRCELFGDAWLSEFLDAPQSAPGEYIEESQKKYGSFDYALVYASDEPSFYSYFQQSPSWVEIKRSATEVLYRRRD